MTRSPSQPAFSFYELLLALVVIILLLALILPILSSARLDSIQTQCMNQQRSIGLIWEIYLRDHEETFPFVSEEPAWQYGGARFSSIDNAPLLDRSRPLSANLNDEGAVLLFSSPADRGIVGTGDLPGTGSHSAFEFHGTSYRANSLLLDARLAGLAGEARGLHRAEVLTVPRRLVVMGSPNWYETREQSGRLANWYGDVDRATVLLMDGSVQFATILPWDKAGPLVFEPQIRGMTVPRP